MMHAAHEHVKFVSILRIKVVDMIKAHFSCGQLVIIKSFHSILIRVSTTIEVELYWHSSPQKTLAGNFLELISFKSKFLYCFKHSTYLLYLWRIDESARSTRVLLPAIDNLNAIGLGYVVEYPLVEFCVLYLFLTIINHTPVAQLFIAASHEGKCCEEN